MPKNEPKYDVTTELTQTEAGRIKTLLQSQGKKIAYRELMGFSPTQAATFTTAVRLRLTPAKLAELAGRDILPEEVPSANKST